MAFTSRQKKQGAVATAAVGALAIGGIAVSALGSSASPADSRPVAAAAMPQAAAAPAAPASPQNPAAAAAETVAVTAQADNTKPGDDTVFTVSGEVTGAKPGTKIRLQRQQASTSRKASQSWTTLAYTTFTDQNGRFSLPVKMETAGSFNLRVEHPQDKEGPQTAYSMPIAVTVSSTTASANDSASTPAKGTTKNSAKNTAKTATGPDKKS